MSPESNGAATNGSLNGRLDGWKEIAAYLGRGVRTAQRWERDLGLPVRRLDTGGAETVYAFQHELDEWLLQQSRVGADSPAPAPAEPERAAGARRSPWWLAAGLVLVLGSASAWFSISAPAPEPAGAARGDREPAEVEVVGNSLVVRGLNHDVLWSHPFEVPLEEFAPGASGGAQNLRRLSAVSDLRGTGRHDVVLARNTPRDPRLYLFDQAGRLVFTHRVERDVSFGDHRCTAVRFSGLFADLDGGEPGVFWVAGHELAGSFPSVLQAVDAAGRVRSEYWSAGFIGAMAVVRLNGRRLILIGSAANETGGAALAVFEGPAHGSSPAADPAYRCAGCPPGTPLHYLVFPPSRLQQELGQNAQVVGIAPESGGRIRVRVVHAGDPSTGGATGSAYYTLDSALRIAKAEQNADVAPVQRKYEAENLVSAATRPRGDADLYPVLRWNGNGYDRVTAAEVR